MKCTTILLYRQITKWKFWTSIHQVSVLCIYSIFDDTLCELPDYPGSFVNIFWKQQCQAATVNGHQVMRWDSSMIRWCLTCDTSPDPLLWCRHLAIPKDATTYTVCNVLYWTQLMTVAKINSCLEQEKYEWMRCILSQICKHSGKHIHSLYKNSIPVTSLSRCIDWSYGHRRHQLPSACLWTQPERTVREVCNELCGDQMYELLCEVVEHLECCGLHVMDVMALVTQWRI